MKKILIACFSIVAMSLVSCSDWLNQEPYDFEVYQPDEEYYENLRAWKATFRDREVSFGWFGGWTGEGANMKSCLAGLPDSTDIISIWGPWHPNTIGEAKRKDLEIAQKKKGLKVLACTFANNIGAGITLPEGMTQEQVWGWGGGSASSEVIEAAIRLYGKALADSVNKAGLDGIDIDHEPNRGGSGNLASYPARMHILFDELAKYFGPASGTGKLLVIDGDPYSLRAETAPLLDYYIMQTYSYQGYAGSDTRLDYQLGRHISAFSTMEPAEVARRFIVCEDFEKYTNTGGMAGYTTRNNDKLVSFLGFAQWKPYYNGVPLARKGGCGSYHMEYAYSATGKNGFYPWLRESIQIMNPSETGND